MLIHPVPMMLGCPVRSAVNFVNLSLKLTWRKCGFIVFGVWWWGIGDDHCCRCCGTSSRGVLVGLAVEAVWLQWSGSGIFDCPSNYSQAMSSIKYPNWKILKKAAQNELAFEREVPRDHKPKHVSNIQSMSPLISPCWRLGQEIQALNKANVEKQGESGTNLKHPRPKEDYEEIRREDRTHRTNMKQLQMLKVRALNKVNTFALVFERFHVSWWNEFLWRTDKC